MKAQVLDVNGTSLKEITLNDKVWGIKPHNQAIFDTVISQQAALRQGTKKTKTRAEVRGGGRKPWRQKGTGRARQGSIRAPQWRGGGVIFGPTPNINYKKAVNKKIKKLAIRSVLSLKAKEENLVILDKFVFTKPSTKEMLNIIKNVKIENEKILILTKEHEDLVVRSAGNIPKLKTIDFKKINIFDLLNANKLLITEEAINKIEEVYA